MKKPRKKAAAQSQPARTWLDNFLDRFAVASFELCRAFDPTFTPEDFWKLVRETDFPPASKSGHSKSPARFNRLAGGKKITRGTHATGNSKTE
jgi:hypothetical protein